MSKKGKKDKQAKKAKVREVVNPDLPVEQTDSETPAAPAKKMSNRGHHRPRQPARLPGRRPARSN
jgi:hypothetical protein